MKYILGLLVALTSIFLASFNGCTKIDTPIRKDEVAPLLIDAEETSILDTQPVIVEVKNAEGPVNWSFDFNGVEESDGDGYFTPRSGEKVLFVPPDISQDCTVVITASEEVEEYAREASIKIELVDEGPPPSRGDILINEIAWAGTMSASYDEYIELINTTGRKFYLNNWRIVNGAGAGKNLVFSGLMREKSVFLITNYEGGSTKSSITCKSNYTDPAIALSNSSFGPFVLEDDSGNEFDVVGDGGTYTYGKNTSEIRASMSRYTGTHTTEWNPDSWYTSGESINLRDETRGTPGTENGDKSLNDVVLENSAAALITEYFIDAKDNIGEDWVELFITRSGSIENFKITDLDGSDSYITNGEGINFNRGDYIVVVWGDEFSREGNVFTIPDTNPTGTKDELVLLNGENFMDCLCYYSTADVQFDDEDAIMEYGWTGDPVNSKYGVRKKIGEDYDSSLTEEAWDTTAVPDPHLN